MIPAEERFVEKVHGNGETQADFVQRNAVHLFARQLVPALDVILDSERIPNRQSNSRNRLQLIGRLLGPSGLVAGSCLAGSVWIGWTGRLMVHTLHSKVSLTLLSTSFLTNDDSGEGTAGFRNGPTSLSAMMTVRCPLR